MGEVFTDVRVANPLDPDKEVRCRALVDTGSYGLVLPLAWKDRLGEFVSVEPIHFELADQRIVAGEVAGPVTIQLDGFRAHSGEIFFMEMRAEDGEYQPLVGHFALEQSLAVVDMVDRKLVLGRRHYNLKAI